MLEEKNALALSAHGMCHLARMGYWVDITKVINDENSKDDVFQKALVLIQVCLFATHFITHKSYGLPISLIELQWFLIVKSFISLRHAPLGVYWIQAWIEMTPHF
jgi:hypothetical protein